MTSSTCTAVHLYDVECLLSDILSWRLVQRQPTPADRKRFANTVLQYLRSVTYLIKQRHDAGKVLGWSWEKLEAEVTDLRKEVNESIVILRSDAE